jgi:multicomponent Na+:H+ antiporter subunit A
MPLIFSIAAYVAVIPVIWGVSGRLPRAVVPIASVPYVAQLLLVASIALGWVPGGYESIDWIPSLGVTIAVSTDSFALLLTAIVAGIGFLIVLYSGGYFADTSKRSRFLAQMSLFTAGMAGVVASDELLGLFVFWEITTVASYLLIGFDDEKAEARASALQAVLVTTSGGLAMLAGFVLLAMASDSTRISTIVADPPTGTMVSVALVLIFLGAFTKSAQFPFHFWLPGAMAAPTPASAFLHSATMVKAGIVLLLLLAPGFATTSLWMWVVTVTGLITMALGAFTAIRQRDLKLLLAYGTVSQLGFMTALIGLGFTAAALAVLVAHSLFKAALFLIVGIVDKATGTRQIGELSGVGARMPMVAVAGAVAAGSMAGLPPLLGFVTKEAAFDTLIGAEEWLPLTVVAVSSAFTVAYAARWWFGTFGTRDDIDPVSVGRPKATMVLAPIVLGILTLGLGIDPSSLANAVKDAAGQNVKLVLWPGFTPALGVSTVVVATGVWLYLARGRDARPTLERPRSLFPRAADVYQATISRLLWTADAVTGFVQNGSLPIYLAVIVTSVLAVPAATWLFTWNPSISLPLWNQPSEIVLAVIAAAGAIAATRAQRRMGAALMIGVVGYAIAGIYVVFSAPDLALTQLLIETLTVGLFALVLVKLPRRFGAEPTSLSSRARIAVSVFAGIVVILGALATSTAVPDRSVADEYIARAPDAGGRNVVNVVLTNFRALDTLGEITVLAAAGIGIGALVRPVLSRRERGGVS